MRFTDRSVPKCEEHGRTPRDSPTRRTNRLCVRRTGRFGPRERRPIEVDPASVTRRTELSVVARGGHVEESRDETNSSSRFVGQLATEDGRSELVLSTCGPSSVPELTAGNGRRRTNGGRRRTNSSRRTPSVYPQGSMEGRRGVQLAGRDCTLQPGTRTRRCRTRGWRVRALSVANLWATLTRSRSAERGQ